jgi:hypothetical protein
MGLLADCARVRGARRQTSVTSPAPSLPLAVQSVGRGIGAIIAADKLLKTYRRD